MDVGIILLAAAVVFLGLVLAHGSRFARYVLREAPEQLEIRLYEKVLL